MALDAAMYRRIRRAVRRRGKLLLAARTPSDALAAVQGSKPTDRLPQALTDYAAATKHPLPTTKPFRATAAAELTRARTKLVAALSASPVGPQTLLVTVRELSRRRRYAEAGALIGRAARMPGLADAAHGAHAIVAVARGRFEVARDHLSAMPRAAALELVPAEVAAVEFMTDPVGAVRTAERVLAGHAARDPAEWLSLARTAFGRGETALCGRVLARIGTGRNIPEHVRVEKRWLERWVDRAHGGEPIEVPIGHVAFAVMDYKQPDYRQTSANVGDYVQTLASVGHLARHQDIRFHGDPALVSVLTELQSRVQPQRRVTGTERDVTVLTVNRDASSLDQVPEGTWMLAFGWYMHNWFKVRWDFPFHRNLRPIFVSFHVNHPEALSEESLKYLADYAPIGCRDWDTVHRLLAIGIPAFFSGCLTTTVDQLFPAEPPTPLAGAPVALVDLPGNRAPGVSAPTVALRHSGIGVRGASFAPNLRRALKMLDDYRTDFSRVATSRLHCYLPVRALGVEVDFLPKNRADIRFDGLIDLDDAQFAAIQEGIRGKLETVLTGILRGDDEESVRKVWREVVADDLAAAQARHQALQP
jgi:hypothetical protein